MSTEVKIFHSGMAGAPVLSGTAGALLAVLQACLVDGWGSATVDSLVVLGGVATVTIAAGHPFEADSVALIAGATVTGGSVNGERRVLSATATTYTFDATGIPDQTATGTITHKVAPLGWERSFTGADKAAYRSANVEGTRMYLRVDDAGTTAARCVGYEAMTDVDTGTGPFPTEAQVAGGTYWPKSGTASATTRAWVVVGNSRGFYVRFDPYSSTSWRVSCFFGDLVPANPLDAYSCSLAAPAVAPSNTASVGAHELSYSTSATISQWVARNSSGASGAVAATRCFDPGPVPSGSTTLYSGNRGAGSFDYPNPADSGLYLSPMVVGTGGGLRGRLPGALMCAQPAAGSFTHLERVTDVLGIPGRELVAVLTSAAVTGVYFIDLTGPWY